MKALATLSSGARLLFCIVLFVAIAAPSVYRTVYPDYPISRQEYADLTQHPYASMLGAALPALVGGLIAYGVLTWLARKSSSKISN